jgi:hypothetical protein
MASRFLILNVVLSTIFFFLIFYQRPFSFHKHLTDTHEVVLSSGDLLFYESSKVFHGRPHRFKGSWYSSVFVHYYPKYGWADTDHDLERHYSVPPHYRESPKHHFEIPLQMVGTGMKEPSCPNDWCQSQYSIKWNITGEHGKWIAPTGEKFDFVPKRVECEDLDGRCLEWVSWETNECKRNAGFSKFFLCPCVSDASQHLLLGLTFRALFLG